MPTFESIMKITVKKIIIIIAGLFIGLSCVAVTITAVGSDQMPTDSSQDIAQNSDLIQGQAIGGLVVKTVLSLILVVAIMILALFGLKWLNIRARGGSEFARQMRVHGSIPLGSKKALYLVQVINKVLVLGVTESNVSLLCEISDEGELKALMQLSGSDKTGTSRSFASHLDNFMRKLK